jgi:hypothetical protein
MAMVRLEVLGQLKNPVTSLEIESATFRLVAMCLNQIRYRVLLMDHILRNMKQSVITLFDVHID